MQGFAFVLFAVFALVLAGMYIAIRRELLAPGVISGVGVVLSMILMTGVSLAQNNPVVWALLIGILLGGLFSGATLAVAFYFHKNELRARYMATEPQPPAQEYEEQT
jgi:Na+/H+-translocating membrane pyrophosphatase